MINLDSISKKYIILSKSIRKKIKDIYYIYKIKDDEALNVDNLNSNSYTALKDVSTKIQFGDNVGIVGLNGSGKTTLLKILLGSLNQSTGYHNIDPNDIELIDNSRVQVDMDLQVTELININLVDFKREERINWIKKILDYFDLEAKSQDKFGTLSLGTRSRLVFAVSTITKKNILLIDEVLGSGDPYWSEKCVLWLKKLSIAKKIILITSHNTQLLQKFCKKGLWIDQGVIKSIGTMSKVAKEYEIFALSLSFGGIGNNSKKINKEESNLNQINNKESKLSIKKDNNKKEKMKINDYQDIVEKEKNIDTCRVRSLLNLRIKKLKVYDYFDNIYDSDFNNKQILKSFPKKLEISYHSFLKKNFWPTVLVTFWGENGERLFTCQNKSYEEESIKNKEYKIIFSWDKYQLSEINMKLTISLFNTKSMLTGFEDLYREDMIYKFCDINIENSIDINYSDIYMRETPLLVNF